MIKKRRRAVYSNKRNKKRKLDLRRRLDPLRPLRRLLNKYKRFKKRSSYTRLKSIKLLGRNRKWYLTRVRIIMLLYRIRSARCFFLFLNFWYYIRYLKRLNKKFKEVFKNKKFYKHEYFLNKFFKKKRFCDFKYLKRIRNLEKFKHKKLKSFSVFRKCKVRRSILSRFEQYPDIRNDHKRRAALSIIKALRSDKFKRSKVLFYVSNIKSLGVFKALRKRSTRLHLKTNEFSGYRILKYLALFSKYGNRRRLFNSFFLNCLNARFNLYRNLDLNCYLDNIDTSLVSFDNSTVDVLDSDDTVIDAPLPLCTSLELKEVLYDSMNLTLLFRRLLFNQFFFLGPKSKISKKKKFSTKLGRLNNSFFLLSTRLLNRFLSEFKLFVEIKPWKKSGRAISVPVPVKSSTRRSFMFAHWFKESVSSNTSSITPIGLRIFNEFNLVSRFEGDSVRKLNHLSRTIRSNRALLRKSGVSLV